MIETLYQNSEYKNIVNVINGLYIPFNLSWKNIGISVSGGADSALLSFILCKLIDENKTNTTVHILSNIRGWKTKPWQRYNSLDVYNFLTKKFPNIQFKRHENFIPPDLEWGNIGPTILDEYNKLCSGDIIEIRAFAEYIGYNENFDAYYNAVTKNPTIRFDNEMEKRNIDLNIDTFYLTITKHMDKIVSHPFRFVDKSWIIKQYKFYNILELLKITRSCEGEFSDIDYTNYIPGQYVPTCNECFWCKERNWAILENE
jgi:hypothetical protein